MLPSFGTCERHLRNNVLSELATTGFAASIVGVQDELSPATIYGR